MPQPATLTDKQIDLIRVFADRGEHPAHLFYIGAGNTARALEPVMTALSLPMAAWGKGIWSGHIITPPGYAKRRAELQAAEDAGFAAFQSISGKINDGKFYTAPRCPYRDAGKVRFWMRGYHAANATHSAES